MRDAMSERRLEEREARAAMLQRQKARAEQWIADLPQAMIFRDWGLDVMRAAA